jgi:hypothetical protein
MSITPRELILLEALEAIEAILDDPDARTAHQVHQIYQVLVRQDVVSAMVDAHNASGRAE